MRFSSFLAGLIPVTLPAVSSALLLFLTTTIACAQPFFSGTFKISAAPTAELFYPHFTIQLGPELSDETWQRIARNPSVTATVRDQSSGESRPAFVFLDVRTRLLNVATFLEGAFVRSATKPVLVELQFAAQEIDNYHLRDIDAAQPDRQTLLGSEKYEAFPYVVAGRRGIPMGIFSVSEYHGYNSVHTLGVMTETGDWRFATAFQKQQLTGAAKKLLLSVLADGETVLLRRWWFKRERGEIDFGRSEVESPDIVVWGKPIALADRLIRPGFSTRAKQQHAVLLESFDSGRKWRVRSTIIQEAGRRFNEPTILQVGEAGLLAIVRAPDHAPDIANRPGPRVYNLYMVRSEDLGLTWSAPVGLPAAQFSGSQPELLRTSSGAVLFCAGDRTGTSGLSRDGKVTDAQDVTGIHCYSSTDDGRSWHDAGVIARSISTDVGQPQLIELPGRRILLVYYVRRSDDRIADVEQSIVPERVFFSPALVLQESTVDRSWIAGAPSRIVTKPECCSTSPPATLVELAPGVRNASMSLTLSDTEIRDGGVMFWLKGSTDASVEASLTDATGRVVVKTRLPGRASSMAPEKQKSDSPPAAAGEAEWSRIELSLNGARRQCRASFGVSTRTFPCDPAGIRLLELKFESTSGETRTFEVSPVLLWPFQPEDPSISPE